MKKLIFILLCICFLSACSEQEQSQNLTVDSSGDENVIIIDVPKGQKVSSIDESVDYSGYWYFSYMVEDMEDNYVPKEKTVYIFRISEKHIYKQVIFKESR